MARGRKATNLVNGISAGTKEVVDGKIKCPRCGKFKTPFWYSITKSRNCYSNSCRICESRRVSLARHLELEDDAAADRCYAGIIKNITTVYFRLSQLKKFRGEPLMEEEAFKQKICAALEVEYASEDYK